MQTYHLTDEFTDAPAEHALLASLSQTPVVYEALLDCLSADLFPMEPATWQALTLST